MKEERKKERVERGSEVTNRRIRLKRRYNGSRDCELITHKLQSNYGAYASASIEKKKERVRSLSSLFLFISLFLSALKDRHYVQSPIRLR